MKKPTDIVSKEEIRQFFAYRPYMRPTDYLEILNISKQRHRDLAMFVLGYKSAKETTHVPNP